jgi:hypothetical protein
MRLLSNPAQPLRLFTRATLQDSFFGAAVMPSIMECPWMSLNYGFICKSGRTHSPAAKAFMDNVRQIENELPA